MILDRSRTEVKALAQAGEYNIKALKHYDICSARKDGKKIEQIASEFHMSSRGIIKVITCKCPELKVN